MAWITAEEMWDKGMAPLDVIDAKGNIIYRNISGFDPETGEVESYVLDTSGKLTFEPGPVTCPKLRRETYPAPLTWKSVNDEEIKHAKANLFDLKGE